MSNETDTPASHSYTVDVDGTRVWEQTIEGDATTTNFPVEYRQRPMAGEVVLTIDDEVVGVQIPLHIEDPELAQAHALVNPAYAWDLHVHAPEMLPADYVPVQPIEPVQEDQP